MTINAISWLIIKKIDLSHRRDCCFTGAIVVVVGGKWTMMKANLVSSKSEFFGLCYSKTFIKWYKNLKILAKSWCRHSCRWRGGSFTAIRSRFLIMILYLNRLKNLGFDWSTLKHISVVGNDEIISGNEIVTILLTYLVYKIFIRRYFL